MKHTIASITYIPLFSQKTDKQKIKYEHIFGCIYHTPSEFMNAGFFLKKTLMKL